MSTVCRGIESPEVVEVEAFAVGPTVSAEKPEPAGRIGPDGRVTPRRGSVQRRRDAFGAVLAVIVTWSLPEIQVHSRLAGSNLQRSLRKSNHPVRLKPHPPNSQSLPAASIRSSPGTWPRGRSSARARPLSRSGRTHLSDRIRRRRSIGSSRDRRTRDRSCFRSDQSES